MNMVRTQKMVRFAWILFLFLPTIAAICWSVYPAASTFTAVLKAEVPEYYKADVLDSKKVLEFRRGLQKHFLAYDLYLPLEDIVAFPAAKKDEQLMKRACGNAKMYIWIPYRFRLPMAGDYIVEHCWKPKVKLL